MPENNTYFGDNNTVVPISEEERGRIVGDIKVDGNTVTYYVKESDDSYGSIKVTKILEEDYSITTKQLDLSGNNYIETSTNSYKPNDVKTSYYKRSYSDGGKTCQPAEDSFKETREFYGDDGRKIEVTNFKEGNGFWKDGNTSVKCTGDGIYYEYEFEQNRDGSYTLEYINGEDYVTINLDHIPSDKELADPNFTDYYDKEVRNLYSGESVNVSAIEKPSEEIPPEEETPNTPASEPETPQEPEEPKIEPLSGEFHGNKLYYDTVKVDAAKSQLNDIKDNYKTDLLTPLEKISEICDTVEVPYNSAFIELEDIETQKVILGEKIEQEFDNAQKIIVSVSDSLMDFFDGGEFSNQSSQVLWNFITFGQYSGTGNDQPSSEKVNDEESLDVLEETDKDETDKEEIVLPENDAILNKLPEDNYNNNDEDENYNDNAVIPGANTTTIDTLEGDEEKVKDDENKLDNIEDILGNGLSNNIFGKDNPLIPSRSYNGSSLEKIKGGLGPAAALALAGTVSTVGGKLLIGKKTEDDELLEEEIFDDNYELLSEDATLEDDNNFDENLDQDTFEKLDIFVEEKEKETEEEENIDFKNDILSLKKSLFS